MGGWNQKDSFWMMVRLSKHQGLGYGQASWRSKRQSKMILEEAGAGRAE